MRLYSLDSLKLDPQLEAEDPAEIAELRECVVQELERLSPRERDALSAWAQLSGESCRSVAKRYGKSPQTVCNWASAAITRLRPRLEAFR
jgi:DNA-directed RNA polymerase specialized sigma24 family protein